MTWPLRRGAAAANRHGTNGTIDDQHNRDATVTRCRAAAEEQACWRGKRWETSGGPRRTAYRLPSPFRVSVSLRRRAKPSFRRLSEWAELLKAKVTAANLRPSDTLTAKQSRPETERPHEATDAVTMPRRCVSIGCELLTNVRNAQIQR